MLLTPPKDNMCITGRCGEVEEVNAYSWGNSQQYPEQIAVSRRSQSSILVTGLVQWSWPMKLSWNAIMKHFGYYDNVGFTAAVSYINTHTHTKCIPKPTAEMEVWKLSPQKYPPLPVITTLTTGKLNIFIVCKVVVMLRKKSSLILLQRTSPKTHILCDKVVIIQPLTCQLKCHKHLCGHTKTLI